MNHLTIFPGEGEETDEFVEEAPKVDVKKKAKKTKKAVEEAPAEEAPAAEAEEAPAEDAAEEAKEEA